MATQHIMDESDIRRRIDHLVKAIQAMGLEGVMALYAPDIVSFDIAPPLQHVGVEAKRKQWLDVFAAFQRPLGYEMRDLTITVGDDVAFGHSLNRISGTLQNGTRTDLWLRWTACLRKIDGAWLIAHDQVSVPVDLASGQALLDLRACVERGHRDSRRSRTWHEAASIQASSLVGNASYSLLSLRVRPSQAKVRSTTQRRLRTRNPVGSVGGACPGPPDGAHPGRGVLDGLHPPVQGGGSPLGEAARVATIDPEQGQASEHLGRAGEELLAALGSGLIGRPDPRLPREARGVDEEGALASADLLTRVVATRPPFPVVLTDWLSRMAALGVGSRPTRTRACSRGTVVLRSQTPASRHCRTYRQTAPHGGRSCGRARHWQPVRSTERMALTISRRG